MQFIYSCMLFQLFFQVTFYINDVNFQRNTVIILFVFFLFCVGDPRRPYPLDIEMRCGALGQISSKNSEEDIEVDRKIVEGIFPTK